MRVWAPPSAGHRPAARSQVLPERSYSAIARSPSAASAPLLEASTLNEPVRCRTKRLASALDIVAAQDYT